MDVGRLIGKPPSARALAQHLSALSAGAVPAPDVKSYSDVVYFNYPTLGVSFQFAPRGGYKPTSGLGREQLSDDDLQLEAVDIYNVAGLATGTAFSTYPRLPTELHTAGETPTVLTIAKDTTGRELVGWLGEPSRKGGGGGSMHIWCEWSAQGIMAELDEAGPLAWERGGDAVWRVLTVFAPRSR